MEEHKIVNGLSYLSIIFAPILFPLIVWVVADNGSDMVATAKRALLLHLIPTALTIVLAIFFIPVAITGGNMATSIVGIVLVAAAFAIDLAMVVYNIVLGVKILIA
ncbi:DUF4870 domain-containing protein [Schleiferilactobacillus shenzhenensis]|uniref:DUF4870 domain-containing protein n=1 Tax=Schleiferilactobacillus shenzhenensis LY-73 TaxID=1231336 RepID=U4TRD9_9LACO|nr:DUF4870 domain-containing protein [Schleiferilactobacillus shenzhenensis]ERL66020.1 hypothetical protein L248_1112 [Schleiferilactobacillus shenzhenensis LY-73]